MAHVVAIANPKGGVGKTTTAINLAASLAHLGKKALVIDTDPSGAAAVGLGVQKEQIKQGVFDLYRHADGINEELIQEAIYPTAQEKLAIMPANVWSSEEEEELFSYAGKLARLRLIRNYLNRSFDYIIIDCPPFVSNITVGALAASDSILIPLQCGFLSLKAMNRLMKVIRKIQDGMNKGLTIEGILLTMYEQGTNISQRTEEEARLVFKEVVFDIKIPKNVKLGEAVFHGLPAILYDARSPGSKAYLELAKELLKKKKKR